MIFGCLNVCIERGQMLIALLKTDEQKKKKKKKNPKIIKKIIDHSTCVSTLLKALKGKTLTLLIMC